MLLASSLWVRITECCANVREIEDVAGVVFMGQNHFVLRQRPEIEGVAGVVFLGQNHLL